MSRARTAITMIVLIAILAAGAYYGWRGLMGGVTGDEPASDVSPEVCTTPQETVRRSGTRVSVYNAGAPPGTATEVMSALTDRNFQEGELDNAPDNVNVKGIAIWVEDSDSAAAKLVRRQFRRARLVERQNSLGPGVNVLVARAFNSLAANAPKRVTVKLPETCE